MGFDDLKVFPAPQKIVKYETDGDTRAPYERIKSYSPEEFELFIREWVVSLRDKYDVRGFGGAGDKGRDVLAKDQSGSIVYYQCKHYNHPLTPSDIIPEFGKLVYYTFIKEIPVPAEYYILSPHDIGAKLSDMIDAPQSINHVLTTEWDKKCKNHIVSTPVDLTPEFQSYIERFDFRIIKTKSMMEIVNEHRSTAFYAFRFGGGLTVKRDRSIVVPPIAEKYEAMYIQKIIQAISEKEGCAIRSLEELLHDFPQYSDTIRINRERFYSAENLKRFASKHLLQDDYFGDLCDDIYYGIYDYLEAAYKNGFERLLRVMSNVAAIDLQHNLLVKYDLVHPQDRQGICHQLANEREDFSWTKTH